MSLAYFDCAQGASAALMLSALSAAHEAGHAAPDAYRLPRGMRLRCIHALEGDSIGRSVELELPEGMDALAMLPDVTKKGVAYVPGTHFFINGGHLNTLRLNFSNAPLDKIQRGMELLAEAFAERM